MKETGVNYIIDGVIGNLDALDEEAAKLQLVDQLENLPDTGQESYAYAGKVSRALVMLEDERGLDVFLTKTPTIRNYSRKDGWSADSPPEKLHKLSLKYQEKFDQSQPNEWDFFWSKFYQLAEARREQGQLLTANDPLIDLESILDGTFETKLVAQIQTTNETKTLRESAAVKAQPEPAVKKGDQESVLAEPMIKETAKAAPVEIVEETPEESTNWLLWLIGALVVLGGLGLVVRRKN
jgi:LPXTG-motif cell wall-anchored protein